MGAESITINHDRVLSHAEKHALWARASAGDRAARDMLIRAHDRLILLTARKYHDHCQHLMLADLYQEAIIGVMRAIEKYEPGHGTNFTTYAIIWIHQTIRRAIADQENMIRIPANSKQRPLHCLTLDMEPDEDGIRLADCLAAPESEPRGSGIDWPGMFARAKLLDREIAVMTARHGGEGATLEKVGKQLQISRERVRQIEADALRKIRAVVGTRAQELARGRGDAVMLGIMRGPGATRKAQQSA